MTKISEVVHIDGAIGVVVLELAAMFPFIATFLTLFRNNGYPWDVVCLVRM